MHIGLCAGPCIEAGDYSTRVKNARRILDGDAKDLIEESIKIIEPFGEKAKNLIDLANFIVSRNN